MDEAFCTMYACGRASERARSTTEWHMVRRSAREGVGFEGANVYAFETEAIIKGGPQLIAQCHITGTSRERERDRDVYAIARTSWSRRVAG